MPVYMEETERGWLLPCRFYFLQQQQEEVMEIHHKLRASDIPPYAQSTVLARLMGQYEQMVGHSSAP